MGSFAFNGEVYAESGLGFVSGIFAKINTRRAVALPAGIALLYFAAGGAYLHKHKDGRPESRDEGKNVEEFCSLR